MMRTLTMLFLGLVMSSSALAHEMTRYERVTEDPVLTGVLRGIAKKYDYQCRLPQENEIQWRCLNGPACGYTMVVRCSDSCGDDKLNIKVVGFDTGALNRIDSIQFEQ